MNNSTQTIAEIIRHRLEQLTPTERKAAVVLLGNYPIPGLQTVAQFAKQAKVSNPTILRLIAKLGCGSYADFQQRLRQELEARLQSPLTKEVVLETPSGEALDFLSLYWRSVTEAMAASLQQIPRSEFDGTVALLADNRRPILILGGRLSASLAEQIYLHLRELRADLHLIRDQTASWAEYLLEVTANHTIIVFDVRRYQDDVIRFAGEAARRGAKIVLFTDEWLSPLSAVAKHVLALRTGVNSNWDSFAPISALIEAIIARLSSLRWPDVKKRIETLEAIRKDVSL